MTRTTIVAIIATAIVVGGGMYWLLTPEAATNIEQIAQFNCEQSGGMFTKRSCQCPTEPKVAGVAAFQYEERTGYCVDSFGLPGGEVGASVKQMQELRILKSE